MIRATARAFCILLLLGAVSSDAQAGWDEARAALKAGKTGTAYRELLPLAEDGDKEAQYMVAYLLSTGNGVKRNYEESYKWYSIAVARGHKSANAARGYVRKKLNFAAAAEAERKARNWLREWGVKEAMRQSEERIEERRRRLEEKEAEDADSADNEADGTGGEAAETATDTPAAATTEPVKN